MDADNSVGSENLTEDLMGNVGISAMTKDVGGRCKKDSSLAPVFWRT